MARQGKHARLAEVMWAVLANLPPPVQRARVLLIALPFMADVNLPQGSWLLRFSREKMKWCSVQRECEKMRTECPFATRSDSSACTERLFIDPDQPAADWK